MDIKAEEITKLLREQLADFEASLDVAEVGTITSVGDGIARVHGLEKAMAGELLKFPHGVFGMALNLDVDSVGAVLFGDTEPSDIALDRCCHLNPSGMELLARGLLPHVRAWASAPDPPDATPTSPE